MTESMFGDTLGTEYTVDIETAAFSPKLPLVENPLTIHLYTGGKWKEGLYVAPYLQASMYETSGNHGGITDGAKVKTELSQPMKVQVILSRPGYSVESASGVPYLRGTGLFAAEPVTNAMLTATTITGGAIPTPVENGHDNGIYEFKIKMGNDPEKNVIEITGSAPVKVPHIAESDQKEDITLNLPIGKDICFKHSAKDTGDRCDWGDQQTLRQWALPPKKTFTSVLPEVATPPILLLDDNGLLAQDVTLQYSIKPTDYTAGQAYLVIYEDNEIFRYAFASVQGTGSLIFSKGSKFDITKNYTVEQVLNYGSDMEMRSDKVVLPVAQIQVMNDEIPPRAADELKFSDGSNHSKGTKKYHIKIKSPSWLSTCETLTGRIVTLSTATATMGQPANTPQIAGSAYASEYPLNFKIIDNECIPRITDTVDGYSIQDKFIISNRPRTDLEVGLPFSNVNKTAVLYAGIGNKFMIEVGGDQKMLPIEPVGVFVIGIDGMRQDVLYKHANDSTNEASYDDPNGCGTGNRCYVELAQVKGLCAVMGGKYDNGLFSTSCDPAGAENKYVKLKDVTTIFPSITFAAWASIFTGKLPNKTGITGNEFFAKDIYNGNDWHIIPGLSSLNKGIVTLDADGGAFRPIVHSGLYQMFDKTKSLPFVLEHVMPADFDVFSHPTLFKKLADSAPGHALRMEATPLWSEINTLTAKRYQTNSDARCDTSNFECRTVTMFNQYAEGADWWGTPAALAKPLWDAWKIIPGTGISYPSALMDSFAADETAGFIGNYFGSPDGRKKKFPALLSVYFPGLDHCAHEQGMGEYRSYFTSITDAKVEKIVEVLKDKDEFDNKIFIIVSDHGHTAMPTGMTYIHESPLYDLESGDFKEIKLTKRDAEMSCSLKTNFVVNSNSDYAGKNAKNAELENNNLHIWELGGV